MRVCACVPECGLECQNPGAAHEAPSSRATTNGRTTVGIPPRLMAVVVGGRAETVWVLPGPRCQEASQIGSLFIVSKIDSALKGKSWGRGLVLLGCG